MRSRLVALILIPTIVGVLLAGIQLADAVGTSAEYRRLTQVAELVQRLGGLSHELGKERSLTAWYIADHRRAGRLTQLKQQREVVNGDKAKVLDLASKIDVAYGPRVQHEVEQMTRWLKGLDGLRGSITGPSVPARAAVRTYSSLIDVLEGLQDELGTVGDDDQLLGDAAAFAALHRAKEEVSRQQVILVVALVERRLDYDDLSDFLGSWNRQQTELATFDQEASAKEAAQYAKTVRGQSVDRADAMRQRALAQLRQYQVIKDLDNTTKRDLTLWFDSTTRTVDAMREVEEGLATSIVAKSRELSDTEERSAYISGGVILALLLLVLIITTRVAGSLVRPLRRLRAEALEVAGARLPETVRLLRESGDAASVPPVPSIGVNTRDEIGEVARAFDEVHREAVRLAGDEAKLRANVNAMFVNLSRRSQTLVERQLQLIEGLEQGEEDESRLSNLFRLDHLATRMRRNSENLLVLAGQEAARKWSEPVPLVDIARASLSEVENYERVNIQIPSTVSVVGPAVTDAVHLLAELIENAISFSPRESKVVVTSTAAEGGVLVTISDLGIGMQGEELEQANWRLANPPVVDVSVSRRMGLFVVGRLALRHGIRVQLRMRETGGLSALVLLPPSLVAPVSAPAPDRHNPFESFSSSFDAPAMAAPYGTDTQDVRGFDGPPVNTPWPGSLPPPGSQGSWPSFGEQPVYGEQPASYNDPLPYRSEPTYTEQPTYNSFASFGDVAVPPPVVDESSWESSWSSQPAAPSTPSSTFDAFASTDYSAHELTGPLPAVVDSPFEEAKEEYLPIFSAVGSDWFRRPDPDPLKSQPPTPPPAAAPAPAPSPAPAASAEPVASTERMPLPQRRPAASMQEPEAPKTDLWASPADAGWQAASAAADPVMGGVTSSGLPRRVPKANLVPGTAGDLSAASPPPPAPPVSPDRLRSRLTSFQQGVRQGRAFTRGDEEPMEEQ
ncbi:nitrate- and nitrite sensing domain-containing protein [Nonomuraea sp. NPDC050556]|uniref:sensor histidine kinase n=1 Tax=Nonomuraea sp. NPDC050556 TaxID=3364369 RepID=UPI00378C8D7A